jgi:hypothetical protein
MYFHEVYRNANAAFTKRRQVIALPWFAGRNERSETSEAKRIGVAEGINDRIFFWFSSRTPKKIYHQKQLEEKRGSPPLLLIFPLLKFSIDYK